MKAVKEAFGTMYILLVDKYCREAANLIALCVARIQLGGIQMIAPEELASRT